MRSPGYSFSNNRQRMPLEEYHLAWHPRPRQFPPSEELGPEHHGPAPCRSLWQRKPNRAAQRMVANNGLGTVSVFTDVRLLLDARFPAASSKWVCCPGTGHTGTAPCVRRILQPHPMSQGCRSVPVKRVSSHEMVLKSVSLCCFYWPIKSRYAQAAEPNVRFQPRAWATVSLLWPRHDSSASNARCRQAVLSSHAVLAHCHQAADFVQLQPALIQA